MQEVVKKKKINGRTKGHSYERALVKLFKELGFSACTTSRLSSKALDDAKVDLFGLPINVQAKAVEKMGCLHSVLESMPKDDKVNVVFHKKNNKGSIVAMSDKDFLKIMKALIELGHLKTT